MATSSSEKKKADYEVFDDGLPWGHYIEGIWRPIPKIPLLLAHMGPPPFSVTMPDLSLRHIVHAPEPVMVEVTPSPPAPDHLHEEHPAHG